MPVAVSDLALLAAFWGPLMAHLSSERPATKLVAPESLPYLSLV